MTRDTYQEPSQADENYQADILQGVSRTFALTIPQLPRELSRVVSNAYLLCRIADTIEDDKDMSFDLKMKYSQQFIRVVNGEYSSELFSKDLYPDLSDSATDDERDLIKNTPAVIRITHSFNTRQRDALERCVRIMAEGMSTYQGINVKNGLKDLNDMDNYCYYVAGVVGEMLTELFCAYSEEIDKSRKELMQLAVSFGQGLQMTNILKDIWDDQKRDMCWLPQDIFLNHGISLEGLAPDKNNEAFREALAFLIGIAHSHLANALRYTLLIPVKETGIRKFCLWALGMAVLTLQKLNRNRAYTSGQEVKITRRSVKTTIILSNLFVRNNTMLKILFFIASRGLPEQALSEKFNSMANAV